MVLLAAFSLFFKFSLLARPCGRRGQPAGGAVARRQRQGHLRAVVVHRHRGLGAGGIILGSVRGGVDFSLADYGLKVFPVVILGGLDSVTA